jgi:hypothetical protein
VHGNGKGMAKEWQRHGKGRGRGRVIDWMDGQRLKFFFWMIDDSKTIFKMEPTFLRVCGPKIPFCTIGTLKLME